MVSDCLLQNPTLLGKMLHSVVEIMHEVTRVLGVSCLELLTLAKQMRASSLETTTSSVLAWTWGYLLHAWLGEATTAIKACWPSGTRRCSQPHSRRGRTLTCVQNGDSPLPPPIISFVRSFEVNVQHACQRMKDKTWDSSRSPTRYSLGYCHKPRGPCQL